MAQFKNCVIFLIFTFLISIASSQERQPIVAAGQLGNIRGHRAYTFKTGKLYYSFHGIPYAESTAGDGRFKPSVLREGHLSNSTSFYPAYNPLVMCPQRNLLLNLQTASLDKIMRKAYSREKYDASASDTNISAMGAEDCLVLNVHSKNIFRKSNEPYHPVILFIHGGASDSIWGGIWTGVRLLERDIVLVSINYRLGVLGALNLGIDEAPGNAMMYDVITALQWVNKYIEYFGGDKNKVFVAGHSAGSMMAAHLLTSPLSEGLLHGIIGHSGAANAVWGTAREPSIDYHLRVCELVSCFNSTDENNYDEDGKVKVEVLRETAECMKIKTHDELISALSIQEQEQLNEGVGFGFDAKVPSIQNSPHLTIENIFLPKHPNEILKNGSQHDLPLMMGATRHDGSFVLDMTYHDFLLKNNYLNNSNFMKNELMPKLFDIIQGGDPTGGVYAHAIGYTYMGDALLATDWDSKVYGLIDIHTIYAFKEPIYTTIQYHYEKNPNCYFFSFDYFGLWSTYFDDPVPGGIAHIDDMLYLFFTLPLAFPPKDFAVSDRLINYWANFVTYGDPNGQVPENQRVWLPYDPITTPYLKIEEEDSTQFNCRDSWINVSLDLKPQEPENPNPEEPKPEDPNSEEPKPEDPIPEEPNSDEEDPPEKTTKKIPPANQQATASSLNFTKLLTLITFLILFKQFM